MALSAAAALFMVLVESGAKRYAGPGVLTVHMCRCIC